MVTSDTKRRSIGVQDLLILEETVQTGPADGGVRPGLEFFVK